MILKDKIKKFRYSEHLPLRVIYYCLKPFWQIRRFFTDAHFRSALLTNWKFSNKYYQQSVFTKAGRYPRVFAACAKYLNNRPTLRILSFGCSTGEEVATIGAYLPHAVVTGVDVNEWCIKQCKKKHTQNRFIFLHRFSPEFTAASDFDAIFCMAVFQRTENRLRENNNIAQGFTFRQFEAEIIMLDAKLKPGGLFVIDNSDFSFTDTVCAAHYQPLDFVNNKIVRSRPLFDRNDKKTADSQNNFRVFVKDGISNPDF